MPTTNIVVSWSDISKSFGRRTLFSKLSGELHSRQVVVVTGVNGSGKSTFLKIIAGLLAADSGTVERPPLHSIGYASPSLELYGDLTGRENLRFFAGISGCPADRCDKVLELVGLSRASDRYYSSYSSGMKQRLKLAFTLLNSPDLLLLDEPTIALDSNGIAIVDEIIQSHRSLGRCALIATNDQLECKRWADVRLLIGKQAW